MILDLLIPFQLSLETTASATTLFAIKTVNGLLIHRNF